MTAPVRIGLATLAFVLIALWIGPGARIATAWFDFQQTLWPRDRGSQPVVIVSIDEAALEELGQWPWPRSLTALLIDEISLAGPAAIGIDILFSEPDRLSPQAILTQFP
jgi:adenylate cyclase